MVFLMIGKIIAFTMINFMFVLFILSLVIIWFKFKALPKTASEQDKLDIAVRVFIGMCYGVSGMYGYIFHVFFPQTSEYIGWAPSPFQFEIGVANLALSIAGLYAWRAKHDVSFWSAVAIFGGIFYLGAGYGHIKQIIIADNWAPDNAGTILYTEILIALLIPYLIMKYKKLKK